MNVFLTRINVFLWKRGAKQRERWALCWVAVLLIFTSRIQANELFPVPPQIEKNVDFWTKIYSQYSSNHVVIHDKNDLSIIYKVINLNDYKMDSLDVSSQWKLVESIKAEYRHILQKLAEKKPPVNLDSLTIEERHVYIIWSQHEDSRKFFKAAYAVRAQQGLRDHFEESIKRSGNYKDDIEAIFKSYDLPLRLTFLPHVESLFNYKAYSKVGAAGLWQFMRGTGRLYMTINSAVDERLDPIAATHGAAQLLKSNYDELKSWPLAITAYNHGPSGMQRAKQVHRTDDFGIIYKKYQSPMFGFASKNFYAEFLAASHVAENYTAYFGGVEPYPAIQFQSIELQDAAYLKQLAATFKVSVDSLIAYNPAFRHPVIGNQVRVPKGYELRLPYREGFDPREALVQKTKPKPRAQKKSGVKSSIASIAKKTKRSDSLKAMQQMNPLELESYILEKIRTGSTPSLIDNEMENNSAQTSTNVQAN